MHPVREVSWRDELVGAVKTRSELEAFLGKEIPKVNYPLFLPVSLLEKIKRAGETSPLWKQFVPDSRENESWGLDDPIGDHFYSPTAQVVHRYPGRMLLMPTPVCPVVCRYCFRKNELHGDDDLFGPGLEKAFSYMENHPEISEVILSGGDPLMMSDGKLASILQRFRKIKSVKDLRIHTRMPLIVPSRVTDEFLKMIETHSKDFRFFHLAVHANHADEFDRKVSKALHALVETKIAILSQSVLLKGVNDSKKALLDLIHKFLEHRIRPYYLHHPDTVRGGKHFFLSMVEGEKIYREVKKELPGWALPRYVVDSPSGTGKINVEKALLLKQLDGQSKRPY